MNGDLYIDLFLGNIGLNAVYLGGEAGSFTAAPDSDATERTGFTTGAASGDFDNDGYGSRSRSEGVREGGQPYTVCQRVTAMCYYYT